MAQAEASLSVLATIRAEAEAESEPQTPDRPHVLLTVSAGETSARARLAWAEEARAVLGSPPST